MTRYNVKYLSKKIKKKSPKQFKSKINKNAIVTQKETPKQQKKTNERHSATKNTFQQETKKSQKKNKNRLQSDIPNI